MSITYAQLGKSAIVTYESVRRDMFAEEKITKELLGRLAMDIVGATGYEGEYVIKLWRTIDEDPFRQQNRIDVCADVKPVRHGRWNMGHGGNGWNDWYVFECPLCGIKIEDRNGRGVDWEYNYCPNCGAKMDEGEDNE